jgi:hypothetical protein
MRTRIAMLTRTRRGVALLLVLVLMTLCSVMAYAMLANASVQAQVAGNDTAGVQADAVAEAGIELAMYYLQYPSHAASLAAQSGNFPPYWTGGSGISFKNAGGTATVTVATYGTAGNQWSVTSKGTVTTNNGGSLSKTVSAVVQVNYTFVVNQAITSNSNVSLSQNGKVMTINGTSGSSVAGIQTYGTVTLAASATVNGSISSAGVSGTGSWNHSPLTGPSYGMVPAISTIPDYSQPTTGGDTPQTWSGSLTQGLLQLLEALLGSGVNNVLNLLFNTGNGVTSSLQGSLNAGYVYVPNGNLSVTGNVTIGPPPAGYPALVVGQQVTLAAGAKLTVIGLAYIGNGIAAGGSAVSQMSVTGALLTNTATVPSTYLGKLTVDYNAADAAVPNFTSWTPAQTPISVKIVTWNP